MAEMGVGANEPDGIEVAGPDTRRGERGRHDLRAQPLAPGDDHVAGTSAEIAQESEARGQAGELVELLGDEGDQFRARGARPHGGPCRPGVAGAERSDQLGDAGIFAPDGVARDREQLVRDAGHRRDHDDHGLGAVGPDDADSSADRSGVGQRCPAELVHVRGASRWRHGRGGYTARRIKCNARAGRGSAVITAGRSHRPSA